MLHPTRFLLFLLTASLAFAQPKTTAATALWREAVVSAETHDPYEIVLLDGRRFEVRLDASGGAFPENWQQGAERLTLEYDEIRGAALVHCVSGLRFPLVGWQERNHPIDLLAKRDFEADETTTGIVNAYADAARRWEREVERVYGELQRHPASSSRARRHLADAMLSWRRFSEADAASLKSLAAGQSGSKWRVMETEYDEERTRWHARRLLGLWGALRADDLIDGGGKSEEGDSHPGKKKGTPHGSERKQGNIRR